MPQREQYLRAGGVHPAAQRREKPRITPRLRDHGGCLGAVAGDQPARRGHFGERRPPGRAHQRQVLGPARPRAQPARPRQLVHGVGGHPPVGGELAADDGHHAIGRGDDGMATGEVGGAPGRPGRPGGQRA